ncbi:MAG: 50S ribosomal protein L11 methyltransferase [Desulfobacterales bacterium]|nr:50S ribosomal protein L11 methyltransferase [Desulfobacterales bacterium]
MKWIETRVEVEGENNLSAIELVSNIFYDLGVKGLVIEEPCMKMVEEWADDAVVPFDRYAVVGYFPRMDMDTTSDKFDQLEKELAGLKGRSGINYKISSFVIDEEDWAESWKKYFWPERISRYIIVKPTWREYHVESDEIVLEIDPGMAFGTGTHPTTRLCLNMIETYIKNGDTVLDVGTGSGILMIAAAKLGSKKVWGVDNDPVAVEIAGKNMLQNNIHSDIFKTFSGNLVDVVKEPFHLVVANILSHIIIELLDDIKFVLAENGIFVGSGIIEENRDAVIEKMISMGFEILEVRSRQSWVAIAGKLKKE